MPPLLVFCIRPLGCCSKKAAAACPLPDWALARRLFKFQKLISAIQSEGKPETTIGKSRAAKIYRNSA